MKRRVKGIFVTGTDTQVGKTYVSARIARSLAAAGHRVGVYKPTESGCPTENGRPLPHDARILWLAAGSPGEFARVCPQPFIAPLAPHLAAAAAGAAIDRRLLSSGLEYWRERSDVVIVEGVGGLLTPLTDACYVADLALEFGFPLLVVARNALGAINQTLLTLGAAANFGPGLALAGVVLNTRDARPDGSVASNAEEIRRRAQSPLLATLDYRADRFCEPVDWWAVARPGGGPYLLEP